MPSVFFVQRPKLFVAEAGWIGLGEKFRLLFLNQLLTFGRSECRQKCFP